MRVVDLELALRSPGTGSSAEARLAHPGSQAEAVLLSEAPVVLDASALLRHVLDATAYGRALTAQLFADQGLRAAWARARAQADGANLPLRLRLRLTAATGDLHSLRWETLRDPLTDVPLACDERLRLVRYLASADTRPITLGPKPALRALLVVANLRDLSTYGLAEIDVDGEVGRVRKALGGIPLTVVGDHEDAVSRRATLGAIQAALRAGPAILCLICHGQHADDETTLWLEDDAGNTARVAGRVFGELIAQLARPPLLAVLIACEGGGVSHHSGALAALGPRLAQAGVGAVLAMQAKLSLAAARALLPALFAALATDGAIDRAASVARAALRDGGEWWVPALWLRTRDGRLWEDALTAAGSGGIHAGSIGTLQVVTINGGNVGSIIGSQHTYGAPPSPGPASTGGGRAEAVATQRRRPAQHRDTLAHYLEQLAITGSAHARPEVTAGLREARSGIARAKQALAALGASAEDMQDDTP